MKLGNVIRFIDDLTAFNDGWEFEWSFEDHLPRACTQEGEFKQ